MALHCPFVESGCQFSPSDIQSVRSHLRDSALHHLSLLCHDVVQMYTETRSLQSLMMTKQERQLDEAEGRLVTLQHNPGAHLIWKIDEYKKKFNEARVGAKTATYSCPFLTGRSGYKLILLCCPYGDGTAKGKFMSVFASICRGENDGALSWPFSHKIKLTLISQADDPVQREHITFVIKPHLTKENKPFVGRPQTERNAAFGAQNFVDLEMMEKMNFVKDDCIFIRVDVDMENL